MAARQEPGWISFGAELLKGTASLPGAACEGAPPEIFDPPEATDPHKLRAARRRAALSVCSRCEVVEACRAWADTQPLDGAVRGGTVRTRKVRGTK